MIYILDFEDSFTYNIFSELFLINSNIKVIEKKDHQVVLNTFQPSDILIIGPGPGHPDQYTNYFKAIREKVKQGYKVWGICLGHQIIGRALGLEIEHSKKPIHGQTKILKINKIIKKRFNFNFNELEVQSYNSLCFNLTAKNLELLSGLGSSYLENSEELELFYLNKMVSMQFHPESVGTSYRKHIFEKIIEYLL